MTMAMPPMTMTVSAPMTQAASRSVAAAASDALGARWLGTVMGNANLGLAWSSGQEPKDEEAPVALPTVVRVEEEECRKPLENAPAAMEPAHVRGTTLGAAGHCLASTTSSAHGGGNAVMRSSLGVPATGGELFTSHLTESAVVRQATGGP